MVRNEKKLNFSSRVACASRFVLKDTILFWHRANRCATERISVTLRLALEFLSMSIGMSNMRGLQNDDLVLGELESLRAIYATDTVKCPKPFGVVEYNGTVPVKKL